MKDMGKVMAAGEGAPRQPSSIWRKASASGEGAALPALRRGVTLSPPFLDELRARTLAFGRHRAHGEAHQRRARVEGLLPVPQRKDAELLRQRRERLLPLLRLPGAWRRDPFLTDARACPSWTRSRSWPRPAGMEVPAPDPRAQEKAERAAGLYEVMEAAAELVRGATRRHRGRRGARLSRETGHRGGDPQRFGFGFAPDSRGRLKAALRPSGTTSCRGRPADRARGGEGALRPLPRPADFPDPRPARPRHRLQRPHPRRRRAQISELARHAALRQGPHPLQSRPRRRRPAGGRGVLVVEGQMDVIALDQAGIARRRRPARHRR